MMTTMMAIATSTLGAETPHRRRRITERVHTAYHEAGHAALAHGLGFPVKRVSIVPDDDTWGRMYHDIPSWLHELGYHVTPHREARAHKLIMVSLGGAAAIVAYAGRRTWDGTSHDLRDAHDLADCLTGGRAETDALIKWLWIRTRGRIAHPSTWPGVEAIAQALLSRETLNGRQCVDILNQVEQSRYNEIAARSHAVHAEGGMDMTAGIGGGSL